MTIKLLPDCGVIFNEEAHTYSYKGKELKGITSTIIPWMFPDTYAGVPQSVLDNAAAHGHRVHEAIEMADSVGADEDIPESQIYLDMMREHGMKAIAHEYLVTDKKNFASAIDLVIQDKNGDIWLGDVKTTYKLIEPNVTLQLAIYAYLFEKQTKLKVKGVVEVWLPKKNEKSRFIELPRISAAETKNLIAAYLNGEDASPFLSLFEPKVNLPAEVYDAIDVLRKFETEMRWMKEKQEKYKAFILEAFQEAGCKKLESDGLIITYIAPTTSTILDKDLVREKYPDIYNSCQKAVTKNSSIRITIKEK